MGRLQSLGLAFIVILLLGSSAGFAQVCDEPFSRPPYPTRQAFCQLGDLLPDAYSNGKLILCEEMEVDHLISLRQAWASGVCGDDLRRLARDPRNLRLTYWRTNRQKGYLSPEDFALRLPNEVASRVMRDADAVMHDYGIKSREEAMLTRMLAVADRSTKHVRIPLAQISKRFAEKMTIRQIGGQAVVFIGRKAIGVAIGSGAVFEGVYAANWAVGWLITPEQTNRMAMRANVLREIFSEEE